MQGILLAAGFGQRFQTESKTQEDKLLATLRNDKTVLLQSAEVLIQALPNSIAVVQAHQIERINILNALGFHVIKSERAQDGMAYAIADAVKASHAASGWLIALADMPWVSVTLIKTILAKMEHPNSVVAPRFNHQRGQPVAFGKSWYDQLVNLKGDKGARELLIKANIHWVDWHDASIFQDIDTPNDLAQSWI